MSNFLSLAPAVEAGADGVTGERGVSGATGAAKGANGAIIEKAGVDLTGGVGRMTAGAGKTGAAIIDCSAKLAISYYCAIYWARSFSNSFSYACYS